MDSMMCGNNCFSNVSKLCQQVIRVLNSDGLFLITSSGNPDTRLNIFEEPQYNWKVEHTTLNKPNENNIQYVYICRKSSEYDLSSSEDERSYSNEILKDC